MANPLTPQQQKSFANNYLLLPNEVDEQKPILTPEERQALETAKTQSAELMVMKAGLLETTASRGWMYVLRFADTILRDMEREAIDEEDDDKAKGLRRDAKGARKFKAELLKRIELAKNQQPETFLEVSTD